MGAVLNRTTKEYKTGVHTPENNSDRPYPEPTWLQDPNVNALQASNVPIRHWKINPDDTVVEMTAQEKTDLDNEAAALAAEIKRRQAAVDTKSATLRAQGYEHPAASGHIHSLTLEAQSKLEQIRKLGDYPATVSKLNNSSYVIANAADADAMQTAQLTRLHPGIHDPGAVIKNTLAGAANRAAVDAVADNRN